MGQSPPRCSDRSWGPPSPYQRDTGGAFPQGVKRPGLEADYQPPTSAEVKKAWIYLSTPP
jgi:hypothetical protein